MMQHSVGLFSVMSDENAVLPQSSTNIKQQLSGSSSSSGLFDATPQKQQNILSSNTVKSSRKALVDLSNGQVNNRNASILSTPKVNGKGRMGSNLILQTTNKLTKTAPQGTQFIIKQQHDKIKNNENIISVNKNIFKKSVSSDCSSTSKGCLKQQDDGKVKIEASFSKVNSTMPDTYSTDEMLCSRVALGEADIAEDVYDAVMRAAGHISHTLVPTTGFMSSLDNTDFSIDHDFSGYAEVPLNYCDLEDKVACFCDGSDATSFLVPSESFLDE